MIITSNRAFEEWGEIFANDLLASAALDRLTHHAHTSSSAAIASANAAAERKMPSNKITSEAPIKPES